MEAVMDAKRNDTTTVAKVFTEAEYRNDADTVIAYAAAHGVAVVADTAGQTVAVIQIPTTELPTLD
jgi:hypothetical protein